MMNTARNETQIFCPAHPEADLIEDFHAGDMICPECGLVIGDRIVDVGSEWRTFSNDKDAKDSSRVGAAENDLLDSADLSTVIAYGTSDACFDENGRPRYQNRRQISSSDRTLLAAFREIVQMADRLNMQTMIVDRAKVLFKQVHDGKTLKGRSNDAIAAACLYIACRQEEVPRTFKEICAVSRVSKKDIGRVFKLILRNSETTLEQTTTDNLIPRFCSKLYLSRPIQIAAVAIAKKAVEMDLVAGRTPVSVAAAAIFMATLASGEKKTPKEISDVSGAAEVTIRQSYKLMYPKAHKLFPESFKFVTPIEQLPAQ